MFIQIEITTVCNYRCFYCAGRDMPAQSMTLALFDSILLSLPKGRHTISLQGEGEPLAHRRFWDMLARVRDAGHLPYLITNGSLRTTPRLAEYVHMIGVSIDTLDSHEADRIGRIRLHRVLANFEKLLAVAGPDRLIVHTVDYGQDRTALTEYLSRHKVTRHLVQPLQTKSDYRRRYPEIIVSAPMPVNPAPCGYLLQPRMYFFNIDGLRMPCCYIKDASRYDSEAKLLEDFASGKVPAACDGCREVRSRTS
ncbi:MAG: radical SAM protein [Betaproteobacteria bacterium]|nr:radical SAM protein [Betaproteobacteria bacterium]